MSVLSSLVTKLDGDLASFIARDYNCSVEGRIHASWELFPQNQYPQYKILTQTNINHVNNRNYKSGTPVVDLFQRMQKHLMGKTQVFNRRENFIKHDFVALKKDYPYLSITKKLRLLKRGVRGVGFRFRRSRSLPEPRRSSLNPCRQPLPSH